MTEQMLFSNEKRFYYVNIDFKKCSEALVYTFVNIRNSVLDISTVKNTCNGLKKWLEKMVFKKLKRVCYC